MYSYQAERDKLFTERGQRVFLKVRDNAHRLLAESGAFMMTYAWKDDGATDTWMSLACVDRLVELGEIREITNGNCAGQHRVFVRGKE